MTFVSGNNIADTGLENKMNPFIGCAKFLDLTFKKEFSFDEKAVNNSQNVNVQSNPPNNTENMSSTTQSNGGHSVAYIFSPNSVFDSKISNNTVNTEDFRNEKYGNLEFYS